MGKNVNGLTANILGGCHCDNGDGGSRTIRCGRCHSLSECMALNCRLSQGRRAPPRCERFKKRCRLSSGIK